MPRVKGKKYPDSRYTPEQSNYVAKPLPANYGAKYDPYAYKP
jgi:hypothetical protein